MRNVLRSAALACALLAASLSAGCVTVGDLSAGLSAAAGFTVTQSQVDAARASYDAAFLSPAAHYQSPTRAWCKPGQSFLKDQCKQATIVRALQAADNSVDKAFRDLQAMITAGNNSGMQAAFAALQTAVKAAEGLVTTFGLTSS